MKDSNLILAGALAFSAILGRSSFAAVTAEEATTVAASWIQVVLRERGDWGGEQSPLLGAARVMEQKGHLLAYVFPVQPRGYILVPNDKRLAPVKAYSAQNDLDPNAAHGMAALLRDKLELLRTWLEPVPLPAGQVGPPTPPKVEIDFGTAWAWLLNSAPAALKPPAPVKLDSPAKNYQAGQVLLTTRWGQGLPYNNYCPYLGCTQTDNGRAWVGCVATAAAQIMRYWSWPPYGWTGPWATDTYDWTNMPNTITVSSPAAQQAAVAELSYEVGLSVDMDYGCDGSGAPQSQMVGVYEDVFGYSSGCSSKEREDYTYNEWANLLIAQLNVNRPVQYGISNHSIVCDGWKMEGSLPWFHMNYGWSGSRDTWYTLDALYHGQPEAEEIVDNIVPSIHLGASPAGTYPRASFPYRDVDRDVSCNATFQAGQNLQVLPGLVLSSSALLMFEGAPTLPTRIYHLRADTTRGIRIENGTVKVYTGGGLRLD